jgi:hypothetical protein
MRATPLKTFSKELWSSGPCTSGLFVEGAMLTRSESSVRSAIAAKMSVGAEASWAGRRPAGAFAPAPLRGSPTYEHRSVAGAVFACTAGTLGAVAVLADVFNAAREGDAV